MLVLASPYKLAVPVVLSEASKCIAEHVGYSEPAQTTLISMSERND